MPAKIVAEIIPFRRPKPTKKKKKPGRKLRLEMGVLLCFPRAAEQCKKVADRAL